MFYGSPEDELGFVADSFADVRKRLYAAGFYVDRVFYGTWRGRLSPVGQDYVLARPRRVRPAGAQGSSETVSVRA